MLEAAKLVQDELTKHKHFQMLFDDAQAVIAKHKLQPIILPR
jgi:hypothetical protein